MSDSHLYLNLLDARAKSNLGSQRHARCEAGGEEDGGGGEEEDGGGVSSGARRGEDHPRVWEPPRVSEHH